MPKILSVSSSRADVSILQPVWRALAARHCVELHVLATGAHRAKGADELALPRGVTMHGAGDELGGGSAALAARAMASSAGAIAPLLERNEFDCVLLMGDRLDMIPAAFAALPFNVPLAHLHGGELSYGALDERIRHAITKLAHLHFVSHVEAADRVVRMGEEPWRVHVTGAPGLDWIASVPEMPAAQFASELKLPFKEGFILVTVHPETNAKDPTTPMRAVLGALENSKEPVLITAPNADPGSQALRAMIKTFVHGNANLAFRESLGATLYPNALRHAAAMLGNSSSGLIEAGYFGLPVVDVGGRQDGRSFGPNVQRVPSGSAAVAAALRKIAGAKRRGAAYSPYGDGRAAERIAAVLVELPDRMKLLRKEFSETADGFASKAPWAEPAEKKRAHAL